MKFGFCVIFVEFVYDEKCLIQGFVPNVNQMKSLNNDEIFYQSLELLYVCALSVEDHVVGHCAQIVFVRFDRL